MSSQAFVIPSFVTSAMDSIAESAIHATKGQDNNYVVVASFAVKLFEAGQNTSVHTLFVAQQDKCTVGPAWNVAAAGYRRALKNLGMVLKTTRNMRSGKGAFTLCTEAAEKAAAQAAEAAQQTIADAAAAEAAAGKAAAEAAITSADLAKSMLAKCAKLGIDYRDVIDAMMSQATEAAYEAEAAAAIEAANNEAAALAEAA